MLRSGGVVAVQIYLRCNISSIIRQHCHTYIFLAFNCSKVPLLVVGDFKRELTMDEHLLSWALEAMNVQVDIFHHAALPQKNGFGGSQPAIFQKIFVDDDCPSAGHI